MTQASNIIVFFGGGDAHNLTEKVVSLLKDRGCHLHVVVGSSNPNKEKIRELCDGNDNINYYCQVDNMPEIMASCDIFIGAGGTVSWERMCVGLPGIIYSVADNQVKICKELAKLDLIKYLGKAGKFSSKKLLAALGGIQAGWLQSARIKGMQMVDGYGAKRVASAIRSLSISFEEAGQGDMENIFHWRNHPENRKYSINNKEISLAEHQEWFNKILQDENRHLLIAHADGVPLAVVRFDYGNSAEISLYMVPGMHGKSYGLPLLLAAEKWLKDNTKIKNITAKIIQENIASMKIFTYAFFKEIAREGSAVVMRKNI